MSVKSLFCSKIGNFKYLVKEPSPLLPHVASGKWVGQRWSKTIKR